MDKSTLSIAVTGAGGSGAVTTGLILLEAMARQGYYGIMNRSSGPQIRGGESAVMLHFSNREIHHVPDSYDFLLAMDWFNIERFIDEIPLTTDTLLIYDKNAGQIPVAIDAIGAGMFAVDFKSVIKENPGSRANMLGLGILANILQLKTENIRKALQKTLGRKGDAVVDTNFKAVQAGMLLPIPAVHTAHIPAPLPIISNRWNISGNEACGLGALSGGVRFVAAYPITPATEILEWLAPRLEKLGGGLLQAEDELASVNMIIGASFGGVAALTATSGPGLSLMMEGLGLAVTSETPITVINVMRGGPSTGIPTKSEQADLNIALYGFHGDAPHLVLAPMNISDAVFTTQWAVCLAEQLQTVALVLSDQSIGQSRAIIDQPPALTLPCTRKTPDNTENYKRYQLTDDGVSPMAIPGTVHGMYTADGLEHNSSGTPSSMNDDHQLQMQKRFDKIHGYDFGEHWARLDVQNEQPDMILLSWGSTSNMVLEAANLLRAKGLVVNVILLRLLMPLQKEALQRLLPEGVKLWVVEQNHAGQLFNYLQACQAIPRYASVYARPGPLPMRAAEIAAAVEDTK